MSIQYDKLKKRYSDCIVLFRLGDFYEGFNNDAKTLSRVLGITLTKRGKGENSRPMAGIPYHALDSYLHKLVNAGYKVAIAEQMEEAQAGRIVERDIVKIITKGTIMDEKSLSDSENNYLAAIYNSKIKGGTEWAIAFTDLTTGEFKIKSFFSSLEGFIPDDIVSYVKRLSPSELLLSADSAYTDTFNFGLIQKIDQEEFNFKENFIRLTRQFKTKNLKSFGIEGEKSGIIAAGIIIYYLNNTQRSTLDHITKIRKETDKYMNLDLSTIRNLELLYPLNSSDQKATLIGILGNAKTAMGRRLIRKWILNPLINKTQIKERQDSVEELFKDNIKLSKIQEKLEQMSDLERILGRIGTGNANARDLLTLKNSLEDALEVFNLIIDSKNTLLNIKKGLCKDTIKDAKKVVRLILESIDEEPPNTLTEGNIIKPTYNRELLEIKQAMINGKDWIRNLQAREINRTGISSLKVRYNKVFGYYIEISKSNLDKVPDDYIRKQTLVNAERFITPELKEWEDKILNAQEKVIKLELEIFQEIRNEIAKSIDNLQKISDKISTVDAISNFAEIARLNRYIKPQIVDNGKDVLIIKKGRHPVIEEISEEPFVSNDTELDNKNNELIILTGPNMSGKSTYIRQVALITHMAQIGSFVPAEKMTWSIVDRIFTRIGASDNLAHGESTFLVEMNETANILNNSTNKSLIILDEVGRGTSTYDGVAIAWAIAEYLHEKVKAKTLFATHYHELIELEEKLSGVKNYNVAVKKEGNKVTFLRKIVKGGTDESYGTHVAQLAGIPEEVVERSKEILMNLEHENMFSKDKAKKYIESHTVKTQPIQLAFGISNDEHPAIKKLKQLNPNKLTPLEALSELEKLKKTTEKN